MILHLSVMGLVATLVLIIAQSSWAGGGNQAVSKPLPPKSGSEAAAIASISASDLKTIESLDQKYQGSRSVSMKVEKLTKIGLLGREKKSKGKLVVASGKLRMELSGDEKTLLVINRQNLWAVTYPSGDFKDAAIQVIKGDSTTKKGRSQNIVNLLTQGGLLKFFNATGVQDAKNGEKIYFLHPKNANTDFARAQLRVSKDAQKILGLRYWDDRDNETNFEFSEVAFGKKYEEKYFEFVPPENADVMNL